MWPFESKPTPPPSKGELQRDLAAMDIANVALLFEIPDENDSRYWIVDDSDVLAAIADNQMETDPPHLLTAIEHSPDAHPQMPELVWLLKDRELQGAYHLTGRGGFHHYQAERFINALGRKARRVTWYEPHLRGCHEVEAMQERLWVEDDIFALDDLPDVSDIHHDFTHAFSLTFPPTDAPPHQHANQIAQLGRLMETAFPASSDLYVLGRTYFEPVRGSVFVSLREKGQLNAEKNVKVKGPDTPLFQPQTWIFCEQAFYDHAARHIAELMPAKALLSDIFLRKVAKTVTDARATAQFTSTTGEVFLNAGPSWLKASAGLYRPADFPFRYFDWPK